ncbi:hypothetical protein Ccrd_008633 [Cynara cardunculus var. scolymus]|uniref:Uncharacterized protein n=1 Tax=Cynara cardunculus var. scolymus TaxID=59895 RepID=A0A118JT36_CYNCS|nr:hypothetical protein Ccrd_008633 [Cynara cardunculus var. scolymus]
MSAERVGKRDQKRKIYCLGPGREAPSSLAQSKRLKVEDYRHLLRLTEVKCGRCKIVHNEEASSVYLVYNC